MNSLKLLGLALLAVIIWLFFKREQSYSEVRAALEVSQKKKKLKQLNDKTMKSAKEYKDAKKEFDSAYSAYLDSVAERKHRESE